MRLDGTAGREYKQSTRAYFRKQLNATTKKVGEFRFVDSKTNNLIQLADLCAGSIHRAASGKTDFAVYVDILKARIEEGVTTISLRLLVTPSPVIPAQAGI